MRILQINSATNFGGGERHLIDLTNRLHARGHEISVALRSNAEWREELHFLAQDKLILLPLKNAFDMSSARRLARIIGENRIEIVHAHLGRDYALAALAARLAQTAVKLVLTRHVLFPINRFYKFLLPPKTTFIAVSKAVQNSLLIQKIVRPAQIKLIYNGVDTAAIAAAKQNVNRADLLKQLKPPLSRRFVGIVGEIIAHKGQTDFVLAARMIADKHGDVDYLIVGQDGSPQKQHERQLKDLIAKLDLSARVHLLGWQKDVASILCLLDVFVSASRVEPFGLAIVEAMAAKLPVVATASEGAREILVDGVTGKLVPVNDHKAIAVAVQLFLNNKNVADEFANRAQTAAIQRLDLAGMTTETEKIYLEKI